MIKCDLELDWDQDSYTDVMFQMCQKLHMIFLLLLPSEIYYEAEIAFETLFVDLFLPLVDVLVHYTNMPTKNFFLASALIVPQIHAQGISRYEQRAAIVYARSIFLIHALKL